MTKRAAFVTCVASLVALVLLFVLEDCWHPFSELLLPTSELKTTVSVLLLGSSKNDISDRGINVTIRTSSHDNDNHNTSGPTTTTTTTTTRPKHLKPQQEPFCRWTYPTQDDATLKNQEILNSSCFQWLNQVHYHPQPEPANVRDGPITTRTAPPSSSLSLEKSHRDKNNKNLRYWYFMGDSTMGQMFTQLVGLFHPTKKLVFGGGYNYYNATTLKVSRAHCDVVSDYYKLPRGPISNWTYPNHTIFEGPNGGTIRPGKEYCMDCQGCYHHQVRLTASKVTTTRKRRQRTMATRRRRRRVSTSNNDSENTDADAFFLENLVVEFPLDVESPTSTTRTTQETVILYIQQQQEQRRQERQQERNKEQDKKKNRRNTELDMENDNVTSDIDDDDIDDDDNDDTTTATVCVVNTGIHSQIFRGMPAEPYVEQTLDFLSLLQSTVCGTIIWVTTSATMDVERYAQKNWRLEEWNTKLEHAIVTQQPPLRNYLPSSTTTMTTTINRTQPTRTKNDEEEEHNPLHVWGLDVWNVTLVRPHNDNIHMTRDYYATLGNVFAQLITSGGGGE
jgi:hypothetical protein